jgi:hypothetical protein
MIGRSGWDVSSDLNEPLRGVSLRIDAAATRAALTRRPAIIITIDIFFMVPPIL